MQDDFILDSSFFAWEEDNLSRKQKHQLREGELREVTMLFADIRGFSDISSFLDPEIVHIRMDELMKIFSRCVTFYGGFVDKYIGDAIMALFGAKQASEHDSERAIRAALKMFEQLKLYNSKLRQIPEFEGLDLNMRIGINTGIVSVGKVGQSREGDFTVYGTEVNKASRLESNAPVGRIMVSGHTKDLVDEVFEFEYLGAKELKGIAGKVECWSPIGLSSKASTGIKIYSGTFLGRGSELALLDQALATIISQEKSQDFLEELPPPRPLIIGIQSEAGIGKSRLAYEFYQKHNDKAKFLDAACDGVNRTPLHLFARLLERHFGLSLNESPQSKLAKLKDAFASLEQEVDEDMALQLRDSFALIAWLMEIRIEDDRLKQGGEGLLQHLLMALESTLAAIMVECGKNGKPLVLILDDLHWLDDSSQKLLGHLVSRMSQSKLPSLWLLLYRSSFAVPSFISRMRGWQQIVLKPLEEREITQLVMLNTRHLDLSERSIEEVVKLSAGNPFYLEEWCNYVSTLPEQEWQDMPVPSSLNSLIQSRLDGLPRELRTLLQKAAVIGQEFLVQVLSELERSLDDSSNVEEGLRSLEAQTLIIPQTGFELSGYFFKHISTRDVAYNSLLTSNRKILHQLVAEAIQNIFPDRLEEFSLSLSKHYLKADMPEAALPWLEIAANETLRANDTSLALKLFCNLLEILPSDAYRQRGETLFKCLEIRWMTGDWKELDESLTKLEELGHLAQDNSLLFHKLRLQGMMAFRRGFSEQAKTHWDEAFILAKKEDDPLLICVIENLLGIWHQDRGLWEQALEHHHHSLELARSLKNYMQQAKSLNNMGLLYLDQNQMELAMDAFSQSQILANQHRFLKVEYESIGNIGHALILQERYEEAIPYLLQKLELSEKMNDKLESINALGNLSRVYKNLHKYTQAIAQLERIIKIKQYLGDDDGIKDTSAKLDELRALSKLE